MLSERPMVSPAGQEGLQAPHGQGQAALPPVALLVAAAVLLPAAVAYGLATASEMVVMAAVLAGLGLIAIVARPFWGLVFFVALLFIRPEEMIPALRGTRMALVISLVTLAATWVHLFVNRERFVRTPLNWTMVGFGAVAVFSTFSLGNTVEALQDFGKLVVLVLLVLNLVRTPERYRAYIHALLVFTGYLAIYSIYLFHSGKALEYQGMSRSEATGIFGDPNDLAATITAGIPLLLVRIRNERGMTRFLYLCCVPVFLYAILLTNSRSGMLALLAALGGFTLVFTKHKAAAVMAAGALVGVLLVLGPSRMTTFDNQEASANERFWYWSDGTAQFLQNPIMGYGYGQFMENNAGRTAHNTFVVCYYEFGLVGYFFWMGCVYYAFRRRPRREGEPEPIDSETAELAGARLALASYLVSSFFLTHTYVPIAYVLMSLPMAAHVAFSGGEEVFPLKPRQRFVDMGWIAGLSCASVVFIKFVADMNK